MGTGPARTHKRSQTRSILGGAARGEVRPYMRDVVGQGREKLRKLLIRIQLQVALWKKATLHDRTIFHERPFSFRASSFDSKHTRLFTLHERSIVKHADKLNVSPPVNRPPLWLRIAAWAAVLVWAGTIYWLSSRTGPEIDEMNIFKLSDKIAHFAAFFAGAIPLFLAIRWSFDLTPRAAFLCTMGAVALYGAADEYHQTFTVNRSGADKYDWLADALGGASGALAMTFLYARLPRSYRFAPAGD
jgi:VanZ family protein